MPLPVVITLTSTVPAEWAGEMIVSLVLLITFRPVPGVVPKLTADTVFPAVALSVKWLPLTVTVVPPTEVPDVGEILPNHSEQEYDSYTEYCKEWKRTEHPIRHPTIMKRIHASLY